jgi:hypothetical protein
VKLEGPSQRCGGPFAWAVEQKLGCSDKGMSAFFDDLPLAAPLALFKSCMVG